MRISDFGALRKHSEMKQQLINERQKWEACDNGPGDLDERPYYVDMSDGETSVKACITSNGFIERTATADSVSIFSGQIPGFGGVVGATEVHRSRGVYNGETLVHDQNGSIWPGTGFAYYRDEALHDARTEFVRLESIFQKKA